MRNSYSQSLRATTVKESLLEWRSRGDDGQRQKKSRTFGKFDELPKARGEGTSFASSVTVGNDGGRNAQRSRRRLRTTVMAPTSIPPIPIAIASLLAGHGIRKRSLSPSGALAAFVVGGAICAVPLRTFAVSLIVFYLIGSRATKVGKGQKKSLEEGYEDAGYRTGWQVLCNSLSAFVASVLWSIAFVPGDRDIFAALWAIAGEFTSTPGRVGEYTSEGWCAVSSDTRWSRALLFATLGCGSVRPSLFSTTYNV